MCVAGPGKLISLQQQQCFNREVLHICCNVVKYNKVYVLCNIML